MKAYWDVMQHQVTTGCKMYLIILNIYPCSYIFVSAIPSLTHQPPQLQEKRSLVTLHTVSCSRRMQQLQKTSRITAKIAWSAISARAANRVLLSNKFKTLNLIGRTWFSSAGTTRWSPDPSFAFN